MKGLSFEHPDLLSAWRATVGYRRTAVVVVDDRRTWTCSDLDAASEDLTSRLPPGTAIAGRRVGLAEANGAPWFAAFIALLKRKAVPVLLDASDSAEKTIETAASLGAVGAWTHATWTPTGVSPRPRRERGLVKSTSGSTGLSRGFRFTDAQMLADGRQICEGMGIRTDDVNLAVIPLGHSYGLGNLVIPLLAQGTACVCVPTPLPGALADACRRHKPTVFPAVPILLKALCKSLEEPADFSSLRLVISAGSPIRPEDAKAFHARFGRPVHVFYGSSETGGISYDASGTAAETGRSVGTALPGVSLREHPGRQLEVRSSAVMGKGGHRPADQVQLTSAGELVLLGRRGRMAKIGGRRLDLAGLEAELQRIPGIRTVVVEPHPSRDDCLAAILATNLGLAEVKEAIAAHLPSWKIPSRIKIVSELPVTPRGKVDRAQVRQLLSE